MFERTAQTGKQYQICYAPTAEVGIAIARCLYVVR